MKYVYIVTAGDYSAYRIVQVFSSKQPAEVYAATRNMVTHYADEFIVERWPVDTVDSAAADVKFIVLIDQERPLGGSQWTDPAFSISQVTIEGDVDDAMPSKELHKIHRVNWSGEKRRYLVPVIADNDVHAIKIAQDLFTQYRAQEEEV